MLLLPTITEPGNKEFPMEDLWRVKSSPVDMKDLADLAEYHRFLDRFQAEEAATNTNNLLYGNVRFGAPVKGGQAK